MSEKKISFLTRELEIEGLLHESEGDKAMAVSHPHPLYGGNMYSSVVESLTSAYGQKGYTTLRYNFRGTGQSEGKHDDGVGEQEDVSAALSYLNHLGKTSIDLVGYSFGSWVNALGLANYDHAKRMVLISPPVDVMDFSSLGYSPKIRLVITASGDSYASAGKIKDLLPIWNPEAEFHVIQGTDHFYGSRTAEIEAIIKAFLDKDERW